MDYAIPFKIAFYLHYLLVLEHDLTGLTLKHFGMEIIAKELQLDQGHPDVLRLFLAVYKSFMEVLNLAIQNALFLFTFH